MKKLQIIGAGCKCGAITMHVFEGEAIERLHTDGCVWDCPSCGHEQFIPPLQLLEECYNHLGGKHYELKEKYRNDKEEHND